MAVPLLPILLPIARTIVGYVGKHGINKAIKKFGEKYGAKVVDKAQRIVQEAAKSSTGKLIGRKGQKKMWEERARSRELDYLSRRGEGLRVREEVRRGEKLGTSQKKAPKEGEPLEFKRGGILKKNSIYGIATRGKTKPKYF